MTIDETAKKLLSGQNCKNCSWSLKNIISGVVYLCANSEVVAEPLEHLETYTCELWSNRRISP